MENVWRIRESKSLYYILQDRDMGNEQIDYSRVAVIAYIYYEDTVERYLEYIENISDEIAVYLITSNEKTLIRLNDFACNKKNTYVLKKENRGRDISALVITSKQIFEKYVYVCFVHDKKEKCKEDQKRVEFWIDNLWGNTLKSMGYIKKVLNVFEDNPQIGLLVPPEPYYYMWSSTFWGTEYVRTLILADELGLTNTTIEEKYPVITLGTVFWCRTSAIKKLFDKAWCFEDFADEPMPGEGTVSYAVERIFAYMAQDAGYDTGTVMSEEYAKKLIMLLQREKMESHKMFKDGINIINFLRYRDFYIKKEHIKEYILRHNQIFLYGAGKVGKFYLMLLREMMGCIPEAFLVTNNTLEKRNISGIPVIPFEEIDIDKGTGIIISVVLDSEAEIKAYLLSKNYSDYLCISDIEIEDNLYE